MKRALVVQRWDGGWSTDLKIGSENSFYYSKHVDFRKSPTQLTLLPETVKESSTTVTDLITDMIQLPSGKIVAIGDAGGVYSRATNGTWSKNGTTLTSTSAGMSYDLQKDTIWIPGTTTMHSITNADGRFSGGTFTVNSSAFSAVEDQASTDGHANTYTTTNAINEGATHKLSITPTLEPMYSVKLWITTKGSDALTVTLHDAQNNVLGTSTVAAANITNGALNEFVFSSPVRTTSGENGATYHVHITHATSSSTTVGASTSSNFSTADYRSMANRLVNPNNGLHPVIDFLQYKLIGNERYVAVWEPITATPGSTEFLQHRLRFPQTYEVTSMAIWTEYAAIACEKRSSSATNEYQEGIIFFWDGTSKNWNFMIQVPEGAPYGLFSHKNIIYYYAGGGWWAWSGGNPVKLRQMPNTDTEFTDTSTYFINYPHTQTVRNGILLGAFPSLTSSTTVEHAVYSYGSRDRNFSDSFGYSYDISTGTTTNGTLRLGTLKSFGDKTFLTWRDDSSYGVDKIDPNSDPFGTGTWQSLIHDNGRPNREKKAIELIIDFDTLPTGATITPKYKINRAANWTSGTAATAGDTQVKLNINKQYKEIQVAIDFVATTATPTVYGITLIWDDNSGESD